MMTRNRNSVVDTDGRRQRQRGPDGKFLPKENDELFGKVRKPCSALLKNLMNHRHGWVFNEPVDPSKWEIPDYHVIITTPMDLGTVRAKLKGNAYSHPLEFASDVRLTFANAMKYNPPGHEVHNMAKTLSKIFESKWKAIEEKMSGTQLNPSINIYNGEKLKQASDRPKRPEQNPIPVSGALIEHKFELGIRKPPMTGEMLQNLIKQFEEWTDDIPEQIVAFMKQYNTSAVENGDEIELDFNALNNDALWELQRLVTICLRGKDQGDASVLLKGETSGVDLPVPRSRSQICRESLGSLRKVYSCDNPSEEAVDASNVPPMEFQDMNGGRSKQSSSSSDFESFSNDSDSGRTPSIGSDAYKACSSGSVL